MTISKRLLAVLMAICMTAGVLSVGFTAWAAPTLQERIDAAAPGDTITLTADVTASITINKDLTLDLNGHEIASVRGQSAITVTAGNVRIQDGDVFAFYPKVSSMEMIKTVVDNCKPSIVIRGGNVTLYAVLSLGTLVRIPTTTNSKIPLGNAVYITGGNLTVEKSLLGGRYGIYNNSTTATVTMVDGILVGFVDAAKRINNVACAEGTSKINARDRVFNAIDATFTAEEKGIFSGLMGTRFFLFSKDPIVDIDTNYDDGTLTVTATPDLSNVVERYQYSYKWLPEYATVGSTTVQFSNVGGEYIATFYNVPETDSSVESNINLRYRLWFGLANAAIPYVDGGIADLVEDYMTEIPQMIDNEYNNTVVPKYNEYIGKFAEAYKLLDSTMIEFNGRVIRAADRVEVLTIMKDLFLIGGSKMCSYINANLLTEQEIEQGLDYVFDPGFYVNRELLDADTEYTYLLDEIDAYRVELEEFDFTDLYDYSDILVWAYHNHLDVLDLIPVAKQYVDQLLLDMDNDIVNSAIEAAGLSDYVAMIENISALLDDAQALSDRLVGSADYAWLVTRVEEKTDDQLNAYVDKMVELADNFRSYLNFEISGNFVKLFSQIETATFIAYDEPQVSPLSLQVNGTGTISYSVNNADTHSTNSAADVSFDIGDTITLDAQSTGTKKFLYWVNSTTERILSTNPQYEVKSILSFDVSAVFTDGSLANTVAYTNLTGDIVATESYLAGADSVYVTDILPYVPNMTCLGFGFGEVASIADLRATASVAPEDVLTSSNYKSVQVYKVNAEDDDNFIVIPQYETSGTVNVTVNDGISTEIKTAELFEDLTITATGENFAYWLADDGNITSVYREYKLKAITDVTLTAVYNDTAPVATVRVSSANRVDNKVTFYVERSSSVDYIRTGIIVTENATIGADENAFVAGAEGVSIGTVKSYGLQGVYSGTRNNAMGTVYARGYIELDVNGTRTIIYSDIVSA